MTRFEENMEGFEEHSNNCSDRTFCGQVMLVTDKAVLTGASFYIILMKRVQSVKPVQP